VAAATRFLRDFGWVSHVSLRYQSCAALGSYSDSIADYASFFLLRTQSQLATVRDLQETEVPTPLSPAIARSGLYYATRHEVSCRVLPLPRKRTVIQKCKVYSLTVVAFTTL